MNNERVSSSIQESHLTPSTSPPWASKFNPERKKNRPTQGEAPGEPHIWYTTLTTKRNENSDSGAADVTVSRKTGDLYGAAEPGSRPSGSAWSRSLQPAAASG